MNSLKLIKMMLTATFFMFMTVACDVHQFPEQVVDPGEPDTPVNPEPPDDPDKYVDLNLSLVYETPLYLWEHFYDPKIGDVVESFPEANVDGNHPGTTRIFPGKLTTGFLHTTLRITPVGNSGKPGTEERLLVLTESDSYDHSYSTRLMPGEYEITAWSDFRENEEKKRYYDVSDFRSIKIDYENYEANTDHRDTFRGRIDKADVMEYGENVFVVEMHRPMAKYEFVTTDLSEFLDKETERRGLSTRASMDDYEVKIYYSTYHPSAYNAVDDWLADSSTGVSFTTRTTVTGESEASLGFDYVFINDTNDVGVQATIVVNDLEGNQVAQSKQITVPLRRDHHTLLRGAFLTMNGSGGVGIDPGYNGDHNIIP